LELRQRQDAKALWHNPKKVLSALKRNGI